MLMRFQNYWRCIKATQKLQCEGLEVQPRDVLDFMLMVHMPPIQFNFHWMMIKGLEIPRRQAGTLTNHKRDVLHGVTRLTGGVRFSLFVVDYYNWLSQKKLNWFCTFTWKHYMFFRSWHQILQQKMHWRSSSLTIQLLAQQWSPESSDDSPPPRTQKTDCKRVVLHYPASSVPLSKPVQRRTKLRHTCEPIPWIPLNL